MFLRASRLNSAVPVAGGPFRAACQPEAVLQWRGHGLVQGVAGHLLVRGARCWTSAPHPPGQLHFVIFRSNVLFVLQDKLFFSLEQNLYLDIERFSTREHRMKCLKNN